MTTQLINRSELEIDYLKFNGKLYKFDARKQKHRNVVSKYMEEMGFIPKREGSDWVYYESEEMGMRALFSNYPMNNKKISLSPSISFEFSGHFFINHNADLLIREMIQFFTKKFGAFFRISRVDIMQDIYGAKRPFDYFPDWRGSHNPLIWALRGNPRYCYYHHDNHREPTGFTLSTSRYRLNSYNRNMNLEEKYKSGKISKSYYEFYRNIYGNRDVQRLEVQLKQDACNFFAVLFFEKDYDKDNVLKLTMSNFGRNHALKKKETGKSLCKLDSDEFFSELFFLDLKEEVKNFKTEYHTKTGLKMSDVTFSEKGRSINEMIKMLAKKIAEHSNGSDDSIRYIVGETIKSLKLKVYDFQDEVCNRLVNYQRTINRMFFDIPREAEARGEIDSLCFKLAS